MLLLSLCLCVFFCASVLTLHVSVMKKGVASFV